MLDRPGEQGGVVLQVRAEPVLVGQHQQAVLVGRIEERSDRVLIFGFAGVDDVETEFRLLRQRAGGLGPDEERQEGLAVDEQTAGVGQLHPFVAGQDRVCEETGQENDC